MMYRKDEIEQRGKSARALQTLYRRVNKNHVQNIENDRMSREKHIHKYQTEMKGKAHYRCRIATKNDKTNLYFICQIKFPIFFESTLRSARALLDALLPRTLPPRSMYHGCYVTYIIWIFHHWFWLLADDDATSFDVMLLLLLLNNRQE